MTGTCSCCGSALSSSYKRLFTGLDGACSAGAVSISTNPKFPVTAINIRLDTKAGWAVHYFGNAEEYQTFLEKDH